MCKEFVLSKIVLVHISTRTKKDNSLTSQSWGVITSSHDLTLLIIVAHLTLCLAQSSLEARDFLVVALLAGLVGLLKLFLTGEVLLKGFFSLLKLPLELLNLVLTGLSLRLSCF